MTWQRKVKAGDPLRVSAEAYNRFIDAAQAVESVAISASPGIAGGAPAVRCYNSSGEDAPKGGVVEISTAAGTEEHIEFVKPGAVSGVGLYGILLEPIPAAAAGFVALSGGPWEVLSAVAGVGVTVGAASGSWTASTDGTVWEVVRATTDGVALVRFLGGFGGIEIRDDDPPAEELYEGRVWYNTSA